MTARPAIPSRHWTHTCPVCNRKVRVNKTGTIAAHWPIIPTRFYCDGSRQKAIYERTL